MNWNEISSEIRLSADVLYDDTPIFGEVEYQKTSLWATVEKKVRGSLKEEFGDAYTENDKFD